MQAYVQNVLIKKVAWFVQNELKEIAKVIYIDVRADQTNMGRPYRTR